MKIKKGQKLRVISSQKGEYDAIARSDFDTEKDEWYDVILDQPYLKGIDPNWIKGERVPCSRGLGKIRLRK